MGVVTSKGTRKHFSSGQEVGLAMGVITSKGKFFEWSGQHGCGVTSHTLRLHAS